MMILCSLIEGYFFHVSLLLIQCLYVILFFILIVFRRIRIRCFSDILQKTRIYTCMEKCKGWFIQQEACTLRGI